MFLVNFLELLAHGLQSLYMEIKTECSHNLVSHINLSGRKEDWTPFNKLNRRVYSMEGTPGGRPARDEEWREITQNLPTFGRRICPAHRTVVAYLIYTFYHSGKSRQRGNRTSFWTGCDER